MLSPVLLLAACSKPPASESADSVVVSSDAGAAPAEPTGALGDVTLTTGAEPAVAQPTAAAAPVVEALFVREERVACQGEGAQQCLQVRGSESEPWRIFYAPIEGFEHEPGNAYELRVEVTPVPNPPADGSSFRYRLLSVVSKRRVGK